MHLLDLKVTSTDTLSQCVHEGKKTYDCKICDAQFVAKQVLQKHISKVHEGKRPYACKICDTNYATKQGFKVHISRVHAGPLLSN